MAIRRVQRVKWEDDCGEIEVAETDDRQFNQFYVMITNVHGEDATVYFEPADFAEWVESEILPRYEAAKATAAK